MSLTNETRQLIIANNIDKAHQAIKDAKMLLNAESFVGALNRIYYGVFYIISALAIKHQYSTPKHSQLIGWFNKNYVRHNKIDRGIGKFIYLAFDRRMEGDYNALSTFNYDDIADDLEKMKETIKTIEEIIQSDEKST